MIDLVSLEPMPPWRVGLAILGLRILDIYEYKRFSKDIKPYLRLTKFSIIEIASLYPMVLPTRGIWNWTVHFHKPESNSLARFV